MEINEQNLITELIKGSDPAYRYLYDHYYVSLCHLANQYIKDAAQSEAIVGDTFFHLWEIREKLRIKTSLLGYLVTAVRNRSLNYLALSRVRREVPVSHLPSAATYAEDYYKTSEDFALADVYHKELTQELELALSALPKECKTVFLKSRLEEKKYEEISMELGISVNTVKYHIKHALKLLRERMHEYPAIFVFFYILAQTDYPMF